MDNALVLKIYHFIVISGHQTPIIALCQTEQK